MPVCPFSFGWPMRWAWACLTFSLQFCCSTPLGVVTVDQTSVRVLPLNPRAWAGGLVTHRSNLPLFTIASQLGRRYWRRPYLKVRSAQPHPVETRSHTSQPPLLTRIGHLRTPSWSSWIASTTTSTARTRMALHGACSPTFQRRMRALQV